MRVQDGERKIGGGGSGNRSRRRWEPGRRRQADGDREPRQEDVEGMQWAEGCRDTEAEKETKKSFTMGNVQMLLEASWF